MSAHPYPARDSPQNSEVDRLRARAKELLAMNNDSELTDVLIVALRLADAIEAKMEKNVEKHGGTWK